jgi:hypothetical protein
MSRWARPRKEAPEPSCEFPNVETSLQILAKLETDNKLDSKEALSRMNTCKTSATEKTRVKTKPIAARRDLRILRHPPHSEKWKKNREKDRLCQPIKIEKSPKEFRLTSENIGKIAFRKLPLLSKYAAYG